MLTMMISPIALLAAISAAVSVTEESRAGSVFRFSLSRGYFRMIWLDESAAVLDFADRQPFPPWAQHAEVSLSVDSSGERLIARGADLSITVFKSPFRLAIASGAAKPVSITVLAEESTCCQISVTADDWITSPSAAGPLLLSKSGMAVLAGDAPLSQSDSSTERLRTWRPEKSERLTVVRGDSPKQIFERLHELAPLRPNREPNGFVAPPWIPDDRPTLQGTPRQIVEELVAGSLSRAPMTGLDLRRFARASPPLLERLHVFAAILPFAYCGPEGPLSQAKRLRDSLQPYLDTYRREVEERGFPIVHPLPFQFPRDPQSYQARDQFLLGDELLAAPLLSESSIRDIYLPQGAWTHWRTGKRYSGRQTIQLRAEPDELLLFARNGSIVPWRKHAAIELHYFPQLGAEFFLQNPASTLVTQAHAAPAGDYLRLELENARGDFEWVVHQLYHPRSIEVNGIRIAPRSADNPGGWLYDKAERSLRVPLLGLKNGGAIVNVGFAVPQERFIFE